jgi:hypothetical protein
MATALTGQRDWELPDFAQVHHLLKKDRRTDLPRRVVEVPIGGLAY